MKDERTQMRRILDGFITCIIIIFGIMLVTSGVAISKINTDYLETGVHAGKIVAEINARQISLTTHKGLTLQSEATPEEQKKILAFIPPPVNTVYLLAEEIEEIKNSFN